MSAMCSQVIEFGGTLVWRYMFVVQYFARGSQQWSNAECERDVHVRRREAEVSNTQYVYV